MAKKPRPSPRALARVTGIPETLIRRIHRGAIGPESEAFWTYASALLDGIAANVARTEKRLSGIERALAATKRRTR